VGAELKRSCRKYNQRTRPEELPVSKKLRENLASAKKRLGEQGFTYKELCYGIFKDPKTRKREYKPMEVFEATPWTRLERRRILHFFKEYTPKQNLAIYVIHRNKLCMWKS
jgi:hypothetical protein